MKKIISKDDLAAAIKIAKSGLVFDERFQSVAIVDQDTGFLKAPVALSRTGVQEYYGFELGLIDRAMDKIGVFRPPEEVFRKDTLESFKNMVVTDDHPSEPVTVDNVKTLQAGQVSDISPGTDVVMGTVTITDKDLISKIKDGKVEVSVGYSHGLEENIGEFQGDKYEFVQTNIVGNHLAVVDAGRCGSACKLTIDHTGGKNMLITIDGVKYDIEDPKLAQAILDEKGKHDSQIKSKDAEIEAAKGETEAEKKKRMEAEKAKDEAEATKDAALKTVLDDDAISSLVTVKAALMADAKTILGDSFKDLTKDCGSCDTKMKAAVIGHVMGDDIDLSGKSDDYIAAMYDQAIVKHGKAKKSTDALSGDLTDDKGNVVTRDSLRENHNKTTLGLEV